MRLRKISTSIAAFVVSMSTMLTTAMASNTHNYFYKDGNGEYLHMYLDYQNGLLKDKVWFYAQNLGNTSLENACYKARVYVVNSDEKYIIEKIVDYHNNGKVSVDKKISNTSWVKAYADLDDDGKNDGGYLKSDGAGTKYYK